MKSEIHEHQRVMLQMLCEVDRICRIHKINYQLFAGTALGAIRHRGFIPWDDDLDVIMLRSDYKRFLQVASGELDSDLYYLQKEFSDHWPMFYTKLRKNDTACIERYIPKDTDTHLGVYIDIFPCDNLREGIFLRKVQFAASKVVIAKALDKRGYCTDSKKKKVFMLCCKLLPLKLMLSFVKYSKGQSTSMVHTFFGASSKYKKSVFPRSWITESIYVPFEGGEFPISAYYHEMLTCLYGDYMTPLPEEQRGCKIHGEIVDLERSYKDYIGIQSTLEFKEYTRSIR